MTQGERRRISIARRGLMLVLSSPSGAGKTTLSRKLLDRTNTTSQLSVSVTTRPRRPRRDRRRALSFHRRRRSSRQMRDAASCSNGPRCTAITTARRASRWRTRSPRAATCCSTSTGRARSSCARRRASDVVSVFVLPPSAAELKCAAERARRGQRRESSRQRMRNGVRRDRATGRNTIMSRINRDLDASLSTAARDP